MQFKRWRFIGLEKGIVRVVPHHPGWQRAFAQERRVLQEHIGGHVLDIQHVGSTAVPGLDAKPIIDIAVAVASTGAIAQCRQPLHDLGYIDRGDRGMEGGYLFVKESTPEVRTHHLHMHVLRGTNRVIAGIDLGICEHPTRPITGTSSTEVTLVYVGHQFT